MRLVVVPFCLFAASSLRVCDTEESATTRGAASASVSAAAAGGLKAALTLPRVGGSVSVTDEYSVELALHKNGLVEALVNDARGQLVSPPLELEVTAQAKGGASEKIQLGWVPARGRFEGRAKAGVELVPGAVQVALNVAGKAHPLELNVQVALPEPELGGAVLVAGGYSAELFARPNGEVLAFVKDGAGAAVNAAAGASLQVTVSAKGGMRESIDLAFDPARACFAGHAKAGVELAPGPVELIVKAKAGVAVGRLENMALSVEASHGGQLVATGDYSVELVGKGPQISAFVVDAAGKVHAAGDLDLKLDIGADAGSHIALKWDPPSLSYKGSAAAHVDLSLTPIRVSLIASGKAFTGAVASLRAAAKVNANVNAKLDASAKLDTDAKLDAGGKLAANGKAKLDPKLAAAAEAKASASKGASASINVAPPKVNVSTKQSASASTGAKAGGGAKASAGFSLGLK
jgi:hypothetical protein